MQVPLQTMICPSEHPSLYILPPPEEQEQEHCCSICSFTLGVPRNSFDGKIEKPVILPCSHVFGSLCISRWLDHDSMRRDCPVCRRVMRYTGCGCAIRPWEIRLSEAGKLGVGKEVGGRFGGEKKGEWPSVCKACRLMRGEDEIDRGEEEGELKEVLMLLRRRGEAELRALEGLRGLSGRRGFGLRGYDSGFFFSMPLH